LSAAPEVKPLADEPVIASGEPVPRSEETPSAAETKVVEASAEPVEVEVVDAEPVEPEKPGNGKSRKK